jgi:hypothetical protein
MNTIILGSSAAIMQRCPPKQAREPELRVGTPEYSDLQSLPQIASLTRL